MVLFVYKRFYVIVGFCILIIDISTKTLNSALVRIYKMNGKMSIKTILKNQKLTDFSTTKTLVLMNAVKNVPSELKTKCTSVNCLLSDYF